VGEQEHGEGTTNGMEQTHFGAVRRKTPTHNLSREQNASSGQLRAICLRGFPLSDELKSRAKSAPGSVQITIAMYY
jgi:hypothetical protein